MKDILKLFGFAIVFLLLVALMAVGLGLIEVPTRILQREVLQQSPQYTITQVSALRKLNNEVKEIDVKLSQTENPETTKALKAQRKAIIKQMREIADLIPKSEIPPDILTTLQQGGY